jgi:solute carrier family 25 phosphate transporter 3
MSKQVSFDIFAGILWGLFNAYDLKKIDLKVVEWKWVISLSAAFIAAILACLSSQPGDVILTATYKSSATSFGETIKRIYKDYGIGGFFVGTGARIAHVAAIITSQLVLYDIIKLLLGLPTTGSH